MAQVAVAFTQPASMGQDVRVLLGGDPVYGLDDILFFAGYGAYRVVNVVFESTLYRQYDLRLIGKDASPGAVVPRGVVVIMEADGVTHNALVYSSTIALSFRERDYRTLLLDGNITFMAQHHFPAKSITVRMRNLSGTLTRTLSFPPSWIFLGNPGRPSTLLPSRTAVLSITSFGTSDGDVIAAWSAQA